MNFLLGKKNYFQVQTVSFRECMDVSENSGTPKSSILNHFNRVFHYKPSILGYPYFWKHPYQCSITPLHPNQFPLPGSANCQVRGPGQILAKIMLSSGGGSFTWCWRCWVGFTPAIKSRMARKNPAKSPKHPLKNMMVNENVFKNHILDFCSWMFLDLIYLGILWFLLKKLRRSSLTTLQARLLWHRSYWTAAPWSPKMYADTGLHLKRDCPGNPAARHFFF